MTLKKNLPLTAHQLKKMMPYARLTKIELFLEPLNLAMEKYQINTPLRIAAFLAQITHESGSLNYVKELASGRAYEWRRDLGNTVSGDGPRFKGRGLIQITGRSNYKACGEALGLDLLTWPERLEEPLAACLSAAWFWHSHGLNELADVEEFDAITKRINGGYRGKIERDTFYEANKKFLGV